MSERSAPGSATPGKGAGSGSPHPDHTAAAEGQAGRQGELSRRELAAKIWAGTGTIIVTGAAGAIVAEFGRGLIPGALTFAIAIAIGAVAALVIYYPSPGHRGIRFRRRNAPNEVAGPARVNAGETAESAPPANRAPVVISLLAGVAALTGISYGIVRAFVSGAVPGTVFLLATVAVAVSAALSWRLRRSWLTWLRRLLPKLVSRSRNTKAKQETSPATGSPAPAKGWIGYPRARVVMSCVLATAGVMTGVELGLGARATACPIPVVLRILTSTEDLPAVQAAIPVFEQDEPTYARSTCFAVQLAAYAPENAPTEAELATDFDSRWDQQALSSIGPEPDVWIPDSTVEVRAVESTVPHGGPTFGRPRPIGYSPLVVAMPSDLVAVHSIGALEQNRSWKTLYADLSYLHIKLALPSPDLSETGLFEITALYGALNSAAEEHRIEASGDFPPDSESLLCEASQTAGQPLGTAYLVSEAAMADYNQSIVDPAEDPCPVPGSARPMEAFYPAGTAALNFPFTTVNWGNNQSAMRRRYEKDFYHFLISAAGVAAVESQGLRPVGQVCGTGGTINLSNGIKEFDRSCESPQALSNTATGSALRAFNRALPDARVLIGIDDSAPMMPNLPPIISAVDTILNPVNTPFGPGDRFGIWELPGKGRAADTQLVKFEPATVANLQQVPRALAGVAPHQHSADYDMLADAANKVLYAQRPVLPGTGRPPVNSVLLLTDGDGYSGRDPNGGTAMSVRRLFTSPKPGESPIVLDIIAFGPAGCTSALLDLADSTHGVCYPANGGDPRQLLGRALDQIAGRG